MKRVGIRDTILGVAFATGVVAFVSLDGVVGRTVVVKTVCVAELRRIRCIPLKKALI